MRMTRAISTETAHEPWQVGEPEGRKPIPLCEFDAILVDLDGVITETAKIHARAWKTMFDEYLKERAVRLGGTYLPFDLKMDYVRFVDGKPRYDGVASFLQSRSIYLLPGKETDPPAKETVCGLGNRKNQLFLNDIGRHGVGIYRTSIDFVRRVKALGVKVAVVTSSRNCHEVLKAAGISDLFDAKVDGVIARQWMLDGKPAPDTYLEAARRLGVKPERTAIIEDAASGVQAGRAGNFALVVGVSRDNQPQILQQSGADIVVSDLDELGLGLEGDKPKSRTPSALEKLAEIRDRIGTRRAAVFLDYDGTLTPIVERPELAVLPDDMRMTLRSLADICTVLVISGRERGDVSRLVGLDGITYAGCHGFDIAGPKGSGIQHDEGARYVPTIAQAARELNRQLASIKGVIVENKIYAVAVHFRMVSDEDVGHVEQVVDSVLSTHSLLRKTGGKKVFELRPNMPWDKGRAVLWLLDTLGLSGGDVVPFYIGDDVTDRDAFVALRGRGISIFVADQSQPTCADYRLSDTDEVRAFLGKLIAILSER